MNKPSLGFKYAVLCLAASTLVACSSSQLQDNETETFSPRIQQDGSKLFDYRLDSPSGEALKPKLVFDANEPTDMNAPPEMSSYSAEDEKASIEARVMTLLDKKLDSTGYCREGYVVIEKMIGFTHSTVTGECREAASAEDRELFGK